MVKALVLVLCSLSLLMTVNGQLSSTFYDQSCKNLITIVRSVVRQAVNAENRMAASLLRLHFHDAFVQGVDASILLAGSSLEQGAFPNVNSIRGLDVVNNAKAAVEKSCPGVVSCADILALIAREAVIALSGPSWTVVFGRRDSLNASQALANQNLPPPTANVSSLINFFQRQELSVQDMVALSGAHTIGQAQCTNFKARLYGSSDPTDRMDTSFNSSLQSKCPQSGGDTNLSPLDVQTPANFDNLYFKNLQSLKGLLFSDETLYVGGQSTTKSLVNTYARSQASFFADFAAAMVKMGNISPLTGSSGEIRLDCSKTN